MNKSYASLATTPRRTGFTLIEIALAIAVVGIGVLAAFALITTGLDSSARASEETQAAFFADATFNTLRAYSTQEARSGTNNFGVFWNEFAAGASTRKLPVAFPRVWKKNIVGRTFMNFTGGSLQTNIFENLALKDGTTVTGIKNTTLRYQFDVTPATASEQTPRSVTLYVWPGKGNDSATATTNAFVFYSEFAYAGNL